MDTFDFTGKKILIVEDEYANYFFLMNLLGRMNAELVYAENGFDAVEACKSDSDINIVLMDMKMPDMDGIEATKKIKEVRPDLPIIAQTAFAFSGDEQRALEAGCDGYISKPIETNRLIRLIVRLLGLSFNN